MGKIYQLYSHLKDTLGDEKNSIDTVYEISSIIENYHASGNVHAVVHIKGTSKTFNKSITDLYKREWLDKFSKEDVAHIGFLYAAEKSNDPLLFKQFPIKKHKVTKNVVILSMLFVSFLILSNLTALKICEVRLENFLWMKLNNPFVLDFPAALILFPMTYFFDDTLTEVYGFKMSRLIIWGGLLVNTIFTFGAWLTVYLPPSKEWNIHTNDGQTAYSFIFNGTWRIFVASAIGYFIGEFLNSYILAKLKVLTSGKLLFLRVIGSTAVGVGVDSIIFCNIAFYAILPHHLIWKLILTQYIFKLFYEVAMLPATYVLTNFLKKVDNVDYYDFETKFNPFSLSLEK